MQATPKTFHASSLATLTLAFAACGGLSGTYSGKETGFLDDLTFHSGGKVDATFMGMTKEGTFKKDGKRVTITVNGDTQVLTLAANGCLEGGGILGTYCKDGSEKKTVVSAGKGGGKLSGTWEAAAPDGTGEKMRLKFKTGGKVDMSLLVPGRDPEATEATYELDGAKLTIYIPNSPQIHLTRDKNVLEGNFMGEGIRFEKQ
jgi:hypothetical protein